MSKPWPARAPPTKPEFEAWTVEETSGVRHRDPWVSTNGTDAVNLKTWITDKYNEALTARCVILLGHVTIPYSGYETGFNDDNSDGHPNHNGPWAADLYYGDVAGSGLPWPQYTSGPDLNKFTYNYSPSEVELRAD